MSRTPNAEQKLAIEHKGGVILRAGAGSGKTFVLVEHIVYLTQCWINEFKQGPRLTFEEFIRSRFSEVVMMTFTKKAAGEMSIRLSDRFLALSNVEDEDQELWVLANESISSLMVTTIDGFCRKLITSGFFPDLSTEAKIIFGAERKDQVCHLVEDWFSLNEGDLELNTLEVVLKEKNKILDAYCNVFADPALRLQWRNFSQANCSLSETESYLNKSFVLNELENVLHVFSDLSLPVDKDQSPFEKMMFDLQSLGDKPISTFERLKQFNKILSAGRLGPQTGKKKCPEYDKAHEVRKILAEWVDSWFTILETFFLHFDSKVLPWTKTISSIFHYVDARLDPNQGMTFGDIEYFVAKGLERSEILDRVLKQYRYYIVDEFQDTSILQFSIIEKLLNNNYKNFFCVGDAKQAIYGFRGGSLEVFNHAKELLEDKTLANNYRSLPGIIRFNNSLFKTLFPLGIEYKDADPFTVEFENQNIPHEKTFEENGKVEILKMKIHSPEDVEKFSISTDGINKLEARIIALDIQEHRKINSGDICTILYSTLKPSNDLIKYLIELEIGFTAQYKIDLLEEPVMGIFVTLLKRKFDTRSENKEAFPLTLIELYFSILEVDVKISEEVLSDFDLSIEYWGLVEGFRKFLFNLGVTNENTDINLDVIETISLLYSQNLEGVLTQITQGTNDRLSLDLRFGENSHMVQIMSSHASKGLEFETVYLGGIYSNGKSKNDGSLLGDLAGSFKWYLDITQKGSLVSPIYFYENEKQRLLDFSELKRLFYVACTRSQKNLKFVNFEFDSEKVFTPPKNSWSCALNLWLDHSNRIEVEDVIEIKHFDLDPYSVLNSDSSAKLPLFFYDSMGLHKKQGQETQFLIAAELSVTRLNSLIDCPRKYYLENILKITPSNEEVKTYVSSESDVEEIAQGVSSAKRGTYIHAQIAEGIEHNFIVPLESFNSEFKKPLTWILDELKQHSGEFEFMAEKPLKFRFFNFMISGIPDLILLSKGEKDTQVWDFKTGRITESNLSHYWIQLQAYAYALFILKRIPISSQVILKLAFVDKEQILEKVVSFSDCRDELYPLWSLQKTPWKINTDHCSQCSYGDICPR